MTASDVEALVLDTIRRYTANDAVAAGSRFDADLRLSDAARQMLFASLAQAFAARGMSLPSHGFLQRDFVACQTPAAVRDAIREKAFGAAPAKADPPRPAAPAAAKAASQPARPKAGTKRPRVAKKPAATNTKATKSSKKRR